MEDPHRVSIPYWWSSQSLYTVLGILTSSVYTVSRILMNSLYTVTRILTNSLYMVSIRILTDSLFTVSRILTNILCIVSWILTNSLYLSIPYWGSSQIVSIQSWESSIHTIDDLLITESRDFTDCLYIKHIRSSLRVSCGILVFMPRGRQHQSLSN
jgi:hypothetical protein